LFADFLRSALSAGAGFFGDGAWYAFVAGGGGAASGIGAAEPIATAGAGCCA